MSKVDRNRQSGEARCEWRFSERTREAGERNDGPSIKDVMVVAVAAEVPTGAEQHQRLGEGLRV